MSKVFVLDTEKRPLDPINPAQARQLLRNKKAAIFRQFPFTIILKKSCPDSPVSSLRLKIDPGAKFTGMALINDSTGEVVFAAELKHRGFAIRDALTSRSQLRRSRRARKTRYRQPRFLNRNLPEGWLAPSLQSRVENIKTWVERLQTVDSLGKRLNLERCIICPYQPPNPKVQVIAEYHQPEQISILDSEIDISSEPAFAQALATLEPVVMAVSFNHQSPQSQSLVVATCYKDKANGLAALSFVDECHPLTQAELELAREVADQLGTAITPYNSQSSRC